MGLPEGTDSCEAGAVWWMGVPDGVELEDQILSNRWGYLMGWGDLDLGMSNGWDCLMEWGYLDQGLSNGQSSLMGQSYLILVGLPTGMS